MRGVKFDAADQIKRKLVSSAVCTLHVILWSWWFVVFISHTRAMYVWPTRNWNYIFFWYKGIDIEIEIIYRKMFWFCWENKL